MDWPRLGAVLHTTGLWGRSYLGVGKRAASRTWQKLCQREDTGLPWGKPYRGRKHICDYLEGNQAIRTPSPVQGLTGDPGELTTVLGLASDCSTSLTAGGAWRTPPGFTFRGTELEEEKVLVSPGEGEWHSKRDTGQFFPPITCYPTHRKKLAQRGDCRILRRCSVSPSPQLCRCLPKRRHAPTHGRRQHSEWSEPSPPGGTALRLVRQGDGLHYPVGQPLFGDSLPFLLTSVGDKELLRASESPGAAHVYAQCSYGTQQRYGWICLLRGQCLQVHHLIAVGRGGNLGHV